MASHSRQRRAHWTEFCDRCEEYTPHRHQDTHTRFCEDDRFDAKGFVKHEREKRCVQCNEATFTIELPRSVLRKLGAAQDVIEMLLAAEREAA